MGRPTRGAESYKTQIIRLRGSDPDMTYADIAARVGCSLSTVRYYCCITGISKNTTQTRWKEKYFKARAEHPDWNIQQIARAIGAPASTLYGIRKASDPEYTGIMHLGRAAAAAGLTLQQIEGMTHARHV